jgi:virginiamycin B lyase
VERYAAGVPMRIAPPWLMLLAGLLASCSSTLAPSPPSRSPGSSPPGLAASPNAFASPAGPNLPGSTAGSPRALAVQTYPVPAGAHPHDVAPASDGGVWYTGQANGTVGWLNPSTGEVHPVGLGKGSAPHGVISGPDGAAWVTDPGLDAIVRITPGTFEVRSYSMPDNVRGTSLHTAAFDRDGILWFTGQRGYVGRLDPATGAIDAFAIPRGAGPYGIAATPAGDVYFASLQASYLGAIDKSSGSVNVLEPPTANAGVRRVWSDSRGRLWVSEWNVGQVGVYDPADRSWREWPLPGDGAMAYAVYVDDRDIVWLSDFGANAIVRFDPTIGTFRSVPAESQPAEVRQLLGRPGELWGAESAADRLIVIRS